MEPGLCAHDGVWFACKIVPPWERPFSDDNWRDYECRQCEQKTVRVVNGKAKCSTCVVAGRPVNARKS